MTGRDVVTSQAPSNVEFLLAIFGHNFHFAHVTGFPDDPSAIDQSRRGACWAGTQYRYSNGELKGEKNQYFTISIFANEQGRAVRRKGNFLATYCIVADDVKHKVPEAQARLLPPPSWKLETSPGNEQWGWILAKPERDRNRVENLLDGLVRLGLAPDGTDPGMKGVTRYVRLPDGWNNKAKYGEPFKCRMVEWHPERRASIEALAGPFGVDLNAQRTDGSAVALAGFEDHPVLNALTVLDQKGEGEYLVECPWVEEHTDGDNSGTILYTHADGSIGFKCHHGHCQDRTGGDLLEHTGLRGHLDAWRAFRGLDAPGGSSGTGGTPRVEGAQTLPAVQEPGAVAVTTAMTPGAGGGATGAGGAVPADDQAQTNQLFDQIRSVIVQVMPDDAASIGRAIDAIAASGLPDVPQEALLHLLKGRVHVGISALRSQLKAAKRRRMDAARAQRAAARAQEPGVMPDGAGLGAPLLRADPGQILYPFTEGDMLDGKAVPHTANLRTLCRHFGIRIYHNLMSHDIEIQIPGASFLEDEKRNLQLIAMKDIAVASNMRVERIEELILTVGCESPYHPFDVWLNQGAWDGVRRFEQLCATVETPTPELFAPVLHTMMKQVIVATRGAYGSRPPRDVLVFTGPQDKGKTTWFRRLLPDGMFGEGLHLDPRDKDSMVKATKYVLCELGELDGTFRRSDIAALKAHISNSVDEVRLPYARQHSRWPRRTIYCATVNDPEFLVDETGNARWQVIEATGFDLDRMRQWREDGTLWQLWKEVEHDLAEQGTWWLADEIKVRMAEQAENHRRIGAIEQALLDKFDWSAPRDRWQHLTATQIGERLGLKKDGSGRNGITPSLRRLVKPITGQTKAKTHRVRDSYIKAWEVPPWVSLI